MAAPPPATGVSEATSTFHNEPWTPEVDRLLLEVDEGWVGYCSDAAWSWRDATYTVFESICRERKWPCHSRPACMAMLNALHTGTISMKLNNANRSSDGYAQWSLDEMKVLGAQMRLVVDGQSLPVGWAAQLAAFVEAMKIGDSKYTINDRTAEEFATRAGKYVPESILRLIDQSNGKTTLKSVVTKAKKTQKAPTLKPKQRPRRADRGQAEVMTEDVIDSDDEPLLPRKKVRAKKQTQPQTKKRRRKRNADDDNSYHDPTSEDESLSWEEILPQRVSDVSAPPTQEITSQGELVPPAPTPNRGRPSLPRDATKQSQSSSARASPRDGPPASRRASPSREETVGGNQNGGAPTRQPSHKHQRVQQPAADRMADRPHLFRRLNPYDRPGKPWGEFVVEVLLAERTARNEDELDYVQFVRGLYEI